MQSIAAIIRAVSWRPAVGLTLMLAGCATLRYTSQFSGVDTVPRETIFAQPDLITAGSEANFTPDLSPNGRYLLYTSDKTGNKDIWEKKINGGYTEQLTRHSADDYGPVMAHNGRRFAFASRRDDAAGDIYVMGLGKDFDNLRGKSENKSARFDLPQTEDSAPAWFHDNERLVFTSRHPGERWPAIMIGDLETMQARQVADLTGMAPVPSPDGNLIAFAKGGALFVYDLKEEKTTQLTSGQIAQDGQPSFSPDGTAIYFIRYLDDTNRDGQLNGDDRPAAWRLSLTISEKGVIPPAVMAEVPITSAEFAAYYPKHQPPFVYFTMQTSSSLDIFRLPDDGHVSLASPEPLARKDIGADDDAFRLTYYYRHQAYVLALREQKEDLRKLLLEEIYLLSKAGRRIEASWTVARLRALFPADEHASNAAEALMTKMSLEPLTFPSQREPLSAKAQQSLAQIEKKIPELQRKLKAADDTVRVVGLGALAIMTARLEGSRKSYYEAIETLDAIPQGPSTPSYLTSDANLLTAELVIEMTDPETAIKKLATVITANRVQPEVARKAATRVLDIVASRFGNSKEKLASIRDEYQSTPWLPAMAHDRIVELYMREGNVDVAVNELRQMIDAYPDAPDVLIEAVAKLVALEEARGRNDAAEKDLRKTVAILDRAGAKVHRQKATAMLINHLLKKAEALLRSGEPALAIDEYRKIIAIEPANVSAHKGQIDALFLRKKLPDAIVTYEELAEKNPRSASFAYFAGYAKTYQIDLSTSVDDRLGWINECIDQLLEARSLDSSVPQIHQTLGWLYHQKQVWTKKEQEQGGFFAAAKKSWSITTDYFGFGDPNWLELATDSYLAAYFLSPPNSLERANLAQNLGETYYELNNFNKSLLYYVERIKQIPTVPMRNVKAEALVLTKAGRAALQIEEFAVASELFQRALKAWETVGEDREISRTLDYLALALVERKDYERALPLYDRLYQINTRLGARENAAVNLINQGYALFKLERYDQALKSYEDADKILVTLENAPNQRKPESDAIAIDIGGQGSEASGFDILSRRIQVASFVAKIYDGAGSVEPAIVATEKKQELQERKRAIGQKDGGKDERYYAEELAVTANNLGTLYVKAGQSQRSAVAYRKAIEYAKLLRPAEQVQPTRDEWLNLLNLGRVDLSRKVRGDLPTEELEATLAIFNGYTEPMLKIEAPSPEVKTIIARLVPVREQLLLVAQSNDPSSTELVQATNYSLELGMDQQAARGVMLSAKALTPNRKREHNAPIYAARNEAVRDVEAGWKYLMAKGMWQEAYALLAERIPSETALFTTRDFLIFDKLFDYRMNHVLPVEDTAGQYRALTEHTALKNVAFARLLYRDKAADLMDRLRPKNRDIREIGQLLGQDDGLVAIHVSEYGPSRAFVQTAHTLWAEPIEVANQDDQTALQKEITRVLRHPELQGKNLYVVGSDAAFSLDWQSLARQPKAKNRGIAFIGSPYDLFWLSANKIIQKTSIAELRQASEQPSPLKEVHRDKEFVALTMINPVEMPYNILHVSLPTVINVERPRYALVSDVNPSPVKPDLTFYNMAKIRFPSTGLLVLANVRTADPETAPSQVTWESYLPIYLHQMVAGIPTVVARNLRGNAEQPTAWPEFYAALQKMPAAQAAMAHPGLIALGQLGMSREEEIQFAKVNLEPARQAGRLREALYYASLLGRQDMINQLLLELRLESQKKLDFAAALYFQERIAERLKEGDAADHADEILTAAALAIKARQHDIATRYLAKARAVYQDEEDEAQLAIVEQYAAINWQEQKNFEKALTSFAKSREHHVADGDSTNAAARLLDMANLYNVSLNNYAAALEYYDKATAEFEQEGDDEALERVAIDKANTLMTIGQVREAIQILSKLLDENDPDDDLIKWIRTAQILSNAYFRAALFQEAIDLNEAIIARTDDVESEETRIALHLDATNLRAMIAAKLGHLDQAMKEFEAGVTVAKEHGLKAKLSLRYNNMGYWLREFGKIEESIAYLEQALAIDRDLKSDSAIAYDLRNLGLSVALLGDRGQAEQYLNEALTLSKKLNLAYNAAYSEFGLGELALRASDWQGAKGHFAAALAIAKEAYLQDFIWRAEASLGLCAAKLDDNESARKSYQSAITLIERLRAGLESESSKTGFQSDKGVQDVYSEYVTLLMRLGESEEAWHVSEKSRARAFIDSLANQTLKIVDPQKRDLLDREKTTRARAELLERKLHRLPAKAPERPRLTAEVKAAHDEHESALASLRKEDPQLAQTVAIDTTTLSELAKLLAKDQAVVEYMVTDRHLYIWLIRDGKIAGRTVEVKGRDLEARIESFRELMQNYSTTQYIGGELSEILMQPIAANLKGIKRLTIVPHSHLHYLAFAALPFGKQQILDEFALSYLESATMARFTLARQGLRATSAATRILAFGNPAVGADLALPFAEKEAETISRYFPKTETFVGEQASESRLRKIGSEFDILHIASHGEFNEKAPAKSRLLLVGGDGEDGSLSVSEVFGLSLKANLVTLSACETGLGKLSSGDEIVGLNRAFFYAGAASLISSLWRINDVASAVIVKRFYRYLAQGMAKDEALRQAQLVVRTYYPHPAYWAALRLLGDPR